MTDPEEAAENLRVIRQLMERATVYRAISAPSGLFAAAVAIPAGVYLALGARAESISPLTYFAIWIAVYVVVDAFNTWLLWIDARRRGAPMLTANLFHAASALAPPLLAGGMLSFFAVEHSLLLATLCWVLFYGLALLATSSFAPASIRVLGLVFTCAAVLLAGAWRIEWLRDDLPTGAWIMAATFGLFHLVYGLAIGGRTGFRLSHVAS